MSSCSLASHLDRMTSMSLLGTSGLAMHACLARLLGRSVKVRHFALTFQVCVLDLGRSSQENASGDPTSHVQHVDPTGMAWRDTR